MKVGKICSSCTSPLLNEPCTSSIWDLGQNEHQALGSATPRGTGKEVDRAEGTFREDADTLTLSMLDRKTVAIIVHRFPEGCVFDIDHEHGHRHERGHEDDQTSFR